MLLLRDPNNNWLVCNVLVQVHKLMRRKGIDEEPESNPHCWWALSLNYQSPHWPSQKIFHAFELLGM